MEVGGQRHAPAALPPGKTPGTHWIRGWVGPRAGVDGYGKSHLQRDSVPTLFTSSWFAWLSSGWLFFIEVMTTLWQVKRGCSKEDWIVMWRAFVWWAWKSVNCAEWLKLTWLQYYELIHVVERSKANVCGPSLAGTAGSNPARSWTSVSCDRCVLSGRDVYDGLIPRLG